MQSGAHCETYVVNAASPTGTKLDEKPDKPMQKADYCDKRWAPKVLS